MNKEPPSYKELERRLSRAEKVLEALGTGEVDALLSNEGVFLLRMQEAEEESRRRTRLVEGINRIFHEALTCETLESLGRLCLAVAEELTQSRFGFIGELDECGDRMNVLSISDTGWDLCDMHDPSKGESRLPRRLSIRGLKGRVLRECQPLFTNDPASHAESSGTPAGHPELTSFLGVPLMHGGRTLGMIGLGNRAQGYGPKELELVEALAPAVAQAFMSKREEEALQRAKEELELRVRERTAALAASEKRALDEAERRRYLAQRLVKLLEEDRRYTAMTLHDDVGQSIVGAKMQIENLKRGLKGLEPHQAARFGCIEASLAQAIAALRRMSRRLHPASLESLGLVPALQSFLEQIPQDGCRVRFFFHGVPESLDPALELAVFRIAQEAILNAVRHAGCREIHLSLLGRGGFLHLTVEDDGCGFVWEGALSQVSVEGPLGLTIMRERALHMGGELYVDSTPDKGTTVVAEFPMATCSTGTR